MPHQTKVTEKTIPAILSGFVEGVQYLYLKKGISPPTSIGYNDFAILFALAQNSSWSGQVEHGDISEALHASRLTPENARGPRALDSYFIRFEEVGLIHRTSTNGYQMDREIATAIQDYAERIMTSGMEGFLRSVAAFYRLD